MKKGKRKNKTEKGEKVRKGWEKVGTREEHGRNKEGTRRGTRRKKGEGTKGLQRAVLCCIVCTGCGSVQATVSCQCLLCVVRGALRCVTVRQKAHASQPRSLTHPQKQRHAHCAPSLLYAPHSEVPRLSSILTVNSWMSQCVSLPTGPNLLPPGSPGVGLS